MYRFMSKQFIALLAGLLVLCSIQFISVYFVRIPLPFELIFFCISVTKYTDKGHPNKMFRFPSPDRPISLEK